jgi:hypothetical protein
MSARKWILMVPVLVVAIGACLLSSVPASAATGYGLQGSFSPPGGFGEPYGVAVDNSSGPDSGDVYVSDRAKEMVYEFSPSGQLLAQASLPGARPEGIVLDDELQEGDLLVVGNGNGVVYRFSPGLTSRQEFVTGLESPTGVAPIEGKQAVSVSEEDGKVLLFNNEGEPVPGSCPGCKAVKLGENVFVEGLEDPRAIAYYSHEGTYANGSGIYVTTRKGTVRYETNQNLVEEVFSPDSGASTGITVASSGNLFVDEPGPGGQMQIGEYEYSGIQSENDDDNAVELVGTSGLGVLSSDSFGVAVSGDSGDLYVADGGHKVVYIFSQAMSISAGTHGATVDAVVNSEGKPTTYDLEYGLSVPYESKTASADLAPSTVPVEVTVQLANLTPGTLYHVRLVTISGGVTHYGPDTTFTTYGEGEGLPDGRVNELVSNFGEPATEVYYPEGAALAPEVQVEGGGSDYPPTSQRLFEASENGDVLAFIGSSGNDGSASEGLELEGNQYLASRSPQDGWMTQNVTPPGDFSAAYFGFSDDLSVGVTSAATEPPLVATEAPNISSLSSLVSDYYGGLYTRVFSENDFDPLANRLPQRSVEEGIREGFGAISADSAHVLFSTDEALPVGGALEIELAGQVQREIKKHEANQELYVEAYGSYSLMNVLPNGALDPGAKFAENLSNTISADGSRVFWMGSETGPSPGVIFMREDATRTVQVSAGQATFWTASPDGRYAFYTESGKLWRFDSENDTRVELAGATGGVQGVIGTNQTGEDGAYLYFVSTEKLTEEENAGKQQAVVGRDNLYVYEPDPGSVGQSKIAFIGTLARSEVLDWTVGLQDRTANLTPDGTGLVFASRRNLAERSYGGEGHEEVYVYDTRDASLYCASCRSQASGGVLPFSINTTHVNRWISEDGDRVFFDSSAPLVAQDVNGLEQVYEWERDGSGSCDEPEGCVYLLSSGIEGQAYFVDASASGNDVFFATRQRLVPEDQDENVDIYDARADGTPPVSSPQCTGTACQGVPSASPIFATPASVTFAGVGNFSPPSPASSGGKVKARSLTRAQKLARALKQCRAKKDAHQRMLCEQGARRRYGAPGTSRKSKSAKGKK